MKRLHKMLLTAIGIVAASSLLMVLLLAGCTLKRDTSSIPIIGEPGENKGMVFLRIPRFQDYVGSEPAEFEPKAILISDRVDLRLLDAGVLITDTSIEVDGLYDVEVIWWVPVGQALSVEADVFNIAVSDMVPVVAGGSYDNVNIAKGETTNVEIICVPVNPIDITPTGSSDYIELNVEGEMHFTYVPAFTTTDFELMSYGESDAGLYLWDLDSLLFMQKSDTFEVALEEVQLNTTIAKTYYLSAVEWMTGIPPVGAATITAVYSRYEGGKHYFSIIVSNDNAQPLSGFSFVLFCEADGIPELYWTFDFPDQFIDVWEVFETEVSWTTTNSVAPWGIGVRDIVWDALDGFIVRVTDVSGQLIIILK